MKNWKIHVFRMMFLLVLVLSFILILLAVEKLGEREGEPLALPAADEVVACYYIPDVERPYEQIWLGGEKLEEALSELATLEFIPAEEPDGGKMVSCLVVATNEEQITVHVDEEGVCWVWIDMKGWMNNEAEKD